jgi:hypothetical protein|tara:strand:- start:52 stop:270 length:219 start_codon:yes stop_codon:yes gene_type:complete
MTLIPINLNGDEGTAWINPEHVLTVFTTNIGHKDRGIIGTGIQMASHFSSHAIVTTNEAIESVIERLQGGAA